MYQNILVPVDGSKRAEKILPYIEELALRSESTVIFLQVIEPSTDVVESYSAANAEREQTKRIVAETKRYLSTMVGELQEKGAAAKCVVEYGPVVRTILDVAEREEADLIAMASHGRTGLARVFYGSVAAGILQQADRPLLLIRSADSQ